MKAIAATNLRAADNRLYFTAPDGLWTSDGTAAGTQLVKAITAANLTPVGAQLYFTAPDGLWTSDGTAADTTLIASIAATQLTAAGTLVYFTTSDGLWMSDGIPAGTLMVKQGSYTANLLAQGSWLYFTTSDGFWITDGTNGDPTLLLSLTYSGGYFYSVTDLKNLNGTVFFIKYIYHKYYGETEELCQTDGTPARTFEVASLALSTPVIYSPMRLGYVDSLVTVHNSVYFTQFSGVYSGTSVFTDTVTLYKSEPTSAGVISVSPLTPQGDLRQHPENFPTLAPRGDNLVFASYDSTAGRELWMSDGTTAGTQLVQDINPGSGNSDPSNFTVAGAYRFFIADDGQHGRELWAMPFSAAPTVTPDLPSQRSLGGSTLSAIVAANNLPTNVTFQIRTSTTTYSTTLSAPATPVIQGGTEFIPVEVTFSHLAPNITYLYRVVASNLLGVTTSSEQAFTTSDWQVLLPIVQKR